MKDNTRIYSVNLFGTPDTYYYLASDVNAIFERRFNERVESVTLVDSLFKTYEGFNDYDTNCYLFIIDYELIYDKIRDRRKYVIAPTMKEAFETVSKEIVGKEKIVLINCQCIAPINYIKSFRELDDEVEAIRIG